MDYSTRQLILLLTKISEAFEKHNGAVDQIRKTNEQNTKTRKEAVEQILAAHNKSEGHRSANEIRQCNVQNSNRCAAWITALATIGAVIAATWYGCTSRRMWQEMQQQTCIQRNTGINSERAWVGLDGPVTIDFLEIVPELKVESHYNIKNFGHGPAFKVFPYGTFVDSMYDNAAKLACDGPIAFATNKVRSPDHPGQMGYILFTNQAHTETIGSPSAPWQGAGEPDLRHFWFIGCVAYVDQFQKVRWTRFCVEPGFSARQTFNKDTPLQFCALYNDAGDGEPPK